jgi:hypothetical protein
MSISYEQAMGIVQEFVQQIREAYPEKILAVYTVGSLAGGYYRPGQSNIDTTVLADATLEELEELREEIDAIASGYCEEYQIPMGFIATVLSKEELYPPYDPQEELPWAILRLKCQSQPVWGSYALDGIPMPDTQAIIAGENAHEDRRAMELPASFQDMSCAVTVNGIFRMLKRYLIIACGKVELDKRRVVREIWERSPAFLDKEALTLVEKVLEQGADAVDGQELAALQRWHESLRKEINHTLLGR